MGVGLPFQEQFERIMGGGPFEDSFYTGSHSNEDEELLKSLAGLTTAMKKLNRQLRKKKKRR